MKLKKKNGKIIIEMFINVLNCLWNVLALHTTPLINVSDIYYRVSETEKKHTKNEQNIKINNLNWTV